MLDTAWLGRQKILVLEPRRIAARGAADRMAKTLGERVGETIGLRARMVSKSGPRTRIEVITEGVFTRMILDDPSLDGVGAVLFDEFHERSLDADLGLALALDTQKALRDDLRILVMSATLDGARVASLLDGAPVIKSEGRAFPVETRYLGRDTNRRIEDQVTDAIGRAVRAERGSLLVFLPGQGEIKRVEERIAGTIADPDIIIAPLYGAMDISAQDRAVEPAPLGKRKIVLATAIAETSLTIEGVRVVIDSGLQRVPRFEPDAGVTRLETVRVSRASADQRRGRAGRTEPGICYRLWDEPQTVSLRPFTEPEILSADLSGLLLDLAEWGVTDPSTLSWLDPPPSSAVMAARAELQTIGALEPDGRITTEGRRVRALPLPPRLARMVLAARSLQAAELAAVLVERGLGGNDTDLEHRLTSFRRDRSRRAEDMRRLATVWAQTAGAPPWSSDDSIAALLALAYPDRIAKARGAPGQFLLANGRGAYVDPGDAIAKSPYLVIAELQGTAAHTRILSATRTSEVEVSALARDRIVESEELTFDTARPCGPRPSRPSPRFHHSGQRIPAGHAVVRNGSPARPRRRSLGPGSFALVESSTAVAPPGDVPARGGGSKFYVARPERRSVVTHRGRLACAVPVARHQAHRYRCWSARPGAGRPDPLGREAKTRLRSSNALYGTHRQPASHRVRWARRSGAVGPGAGTLRPQGPPIDRRRSAATHSQSAIACASADPDHARPARLLVRLMERGEVRDEGPLPTPSLAGRSSGSECDRARKAARHLMHDDGLESPIAGASFDARAPAR